MNQATNYRHDLETAIEVSPSNAIASFGSPDDKLEDLEEQLDILDDDDIPQREEGNTGIDINNMRHHMETDDKIADMEVNEDNVNTGSNAAEALRAQVNAEQSSSLSGNDNSGSSSGSGSGSSSSDSESSDGDTIDSV